MYRKILHAHTHRNTPTETHPQKHTHRNTPTETHPQTETERETHTIPHHTTPHHTTPPKNKVSISHLTPYCVDPTIYKHSFTISLHINLPYSGKTSRWAFAHILTMRPCRCTHKHTNKLISSSNT